LLYPLLLINLFFISVLSSLLECIFYALGSFFFSSNKAFIIYQKKIYIYIFFFLWESEFILKCGKNCGNSIELSEN
jgi:hypothetical protein